MVSNLPASVRVHVHVWHGRPFGWFEKLSPMTTIVSLFAPASQGKTPHKQTQRPLSSLHIIIKPQHTSKLPSPKGSGEPLEIPQFGSHPASCAKGEQTGHAHPPTSG